MNRVGFIGLGNMGSGMCANLIRSGFAVSAFDLNTDAVAAAANEGAKAATSVAEAAEAADILVTMLPAGQHVKAVYFGDEGVSAHAPKGALFIDCSTIAVSDARDVIQQAITQGFDMVDAPVSGGVAAAAGGSLTFMVGGTEDAFQRAHPVLEAMGEKIVHAGNAGNGQVAKIANNMLLGISMIATCEAFNLAEKLGLDAQTFFDIASSASGQNWSMTSYCPAPGPVPTAPSNNDYMPGFAVDMMLKDLRLASEASETIGADTTFGDLATRTYQSLSSEGHGGKDFSVIMKLLKNEL